MAGDSAIEYGVRKQDLLVERPSDPFKHAVNPYVKLPIDVREALDVVLAQVLPDHTAAAAREDYQATAGNDMTGADSARFSEVLKNVTTAGREGITNNFQMAALHLTPQQPAPAPEGESPANTFTPEYGEHNIA